MGPGRIVRLKAAVLAIPEPSRLAFPALVIPVKEYISCMPVVSSSAVKTLFGRALGLFV